MPESATVSNPGTQKPSTPSPQKKVAVEPEAVPNAAPKMQETQKKAPLQVTVINATITSGILFIPFLLLGFLVSAILNQLNPETFTKLLGTLEMSVWSIPVCLVVGTIGGWITYGIGKTRMVVPCFFLPLLGIVLSILLLYVFFLMDGFNPAQS